MNGYRYGVILLALVVGSSPVVSTAECVPPLVGPGHFRNPANAWGGTDTGVVVDRFVNLLGANGQPEPVLHGIDLSSNNVVDYGIIASCGATFAFVRIDGKINAHASALLARNIAVVPYVYFPIPKDLRKASTFSSVDKDEAEVQKLSAQFTDVGRKAANKYLDDVKKMNLDLTVLEARPLAGLSGVSVALDVEEKLLNEQKTTAHDRYTYGRFYAMAVVAWIAEVRSKMPGMQVILYTTPSVYEDYLENAYPEAFETLNGLPIWLARTRDDGGDVMGGNKHSSEEAQRVCLTAGGNRCVVHQYSHRATFGAIGKPIKGIPPHIDIDRFFSVKEVTAGVGILIVRQ